MLCVQIDQGGFVQVLPGVDPVTCAYVLVQPSEVNPFALGVGDAIAIVAAIGAVWGIAFVFRASSRFFK